MTFWGVLKSGGQMLLGEPEETVLSYDKDAPADLLKAVFPAERLWEELCQVLIYRDGKAAFRGVVDEQNTRLGSDGLSVELVCRSLEGILLDNEAAPQVIRGPSLEILGKKILEPLGFLAIAGDKSRKRGELTVEKGMSCWTVLENFCRDYLGTVPYVDANWTVHCESLAAEDRELREVISAEVSFLPCKQISEVWKQGYRGGYDTVYRNTRAAGMRRRYLSAQSEKDPRELLEQGRQESFLLTVTCGGFQWPGRSGTASVTLPRAGRYETCPVQSAVYYRDKRGERTRITLEKGENVLCG